jgi:hypothetical protein
MKNKKQKAYVVSQNDKPYVVKENGIFVQKAVITIHNYTDNPNAKPRPKYFHIKYNFEMAFDVIEFQIPGYAPTQLYRSDLAKLIHVVPTKNKLKDETYFRIYPDAVIPANAQEGKALHNNTVLLKYLTKSNSIDEMLTNYIATLSEEDLKLIVLEHLIRK